MHACMHMQPCQFYLLGISDFFLFLLAFLAFVFTFLLLFLFLLLLLSFPFQTPLLLSLSFFLLFSLSILTSYVLTSEHPFHLSFPWLSSWLSISSSHWMPGGMCVIINNIYIYIHVKSYRLWSSPQRRRILCQKSLTCISFLSSSSSCEWSFRASIIIIIHIHPRSHQRPFLWSFWLRVPYQVESQCLGSGEGCWLYIYLYNIYIQPKNKTNCGTTWHWEL